MKMSLRVDSGDSAVKQYGNQSGNSISGTGNEVHMRISEERLKFATRYATRNASHIASLTIVEPGFDETSAE